MSLVLKQLPPSRPKALADYSGAIDDPRVSTSAIRGERRTLSTTQTMPGVHPDEQFDSSS